MPSQQLSSGGAFGYSSVGENALVNTRIEVPTSYTQTTTINRGEAIVLNTSGQAVLAPATVAGGCTCIGVAAETVGPSADNSALVPIVVFGQFNLATTTYTDGTWTAGNPITVSGNTAGYLSSATTGGATGVQTTPIIIGQVITSTSTNSMIWINPR